MSDELPQGWVTAPVNEVVEDFQPGFASGQKNIEGGVAHLRMNNIGLSGELVLDLIRTVPEKLAKPHHDLRRGDVLVCTTNSGKLVGKCAYFDLTGRYAFSNHLTRLRPKSGVVDGKFLCWSLWLDWQHGAFDDKCKHWVNQSTLPKDALLENNVTLPPLAEQKRIVAKLEEVLSQVDACKERLARIPALLKRFRQSVLAAACSGRLTADWREANPRDDDAEGLTKAVLNHRGEFWKRSNRKGACPEAAQRDTSRLPDLPLGWSWIPLGILGANPFETAQTGPFGALLHKEEFTPSGVPVVAVGNLTGMGFTKKGLYFVTDTKAEQLSRFDIQAGDVLFARSGATLGKVCVAPREAKDWRMTGHILRARLNQTFLLPDFCVFALRGDPAVMHQVFGSVQGTTRPGFNTTLLESIALPVPPLAEQHEIVRRVEDLFKLADQIEARFTKANAHVGKLTQSVLAKAFRGELVPQDPNDEPAQKLLERIQRERQTGGNHDCPG